MREKLNDEVLDKVAGGTVIISRDKMKIGFTSMSRAYKLIDCTFREAQDLAEDLWEANSTLGDAAFDTLVRDEFLARGWISE